MAGRSMSEVAAIQVLFQCDSELVVNEEERQSDLASLPTGLP
jgi:hypothetical protein